MNDQRRNLAELQFGRHARLLGVQSFLREEVAVCAAPAGALSRTRTPQRADPATVANDELSLNNILALGEPRHSRRDLPAR